MVTVILVLERVVILGTDLGSASKSCSCYHCCFCYIADGATVVAAAPVGAAVVTAAPVGPVPALHGGVAAPISASVVYDGAAGSVSFCYC